MKRKQDSPLFLCHVTHYNNIAILVHKLHVLNCIKNWLGLLLMQIIVESLTSMGVLDTMGENIGDISVVEFSLLYIPQGLNSAYPFHL